MATLSPSSVCLGSHDATNSQTVTERRPQTPFDRNKDELDLTDIPKESLLFGQNCDGDRADMRRAHNRAWQVCVVVVTSLFCPQVGGGGDGCHGHIEIFSLNRPVPRAVKSLLVGSAVRCLEYVPEPSSDEETVAGSHKAPPGLGAHICVGLNDGR